MATREFPLVPEKVAPVRTKYRRIVTDIPAPQSIPLLQRLRDLEPRSMGGQPPIVWDHGSGFTISDAYGNTWLDFSSGVLVTACGHARPEIVQAIQEQAARLYHSYCFPTEARLRLIEEISSVLPPPLKRVFLLTTGAEATECCIKLARTKGLAVGGATKSILVSFSTGFHGRTMGAQWAGGSAALKSWLGQPDERFVQVPFPEGYRQEDVSFAVFVKTLKDAGVRGEDVCGVMGETYQGANATLLPKQYAQDLRKWCDAHQAVLALDEVQAAFGRCGKWFGFQHLGIVPDLAACGKGISGGMPLSAVIGTDELMDLYGPGEMTSTHSGNAVCATAAAANIQVLKKDKLIENAAALAPTMAEGAAKIAAASKGRIGRWDGTGLVCALQFTKAGTKDPDPEPAWEFVRRAIQKGIMLFAPVGMGGCAIKINPPLCITKEALREGLEVLEGVAREV
jgi:4-aminobutyrate aminotransferase / (S)-3-amino-2-methylpropionate transaminase / 5-aminovalerate transaminase